MLWYGLLVFSLLLAVFFKLLIKYYPNHVKREDGFYYLDEIEEPIFRPNKKIVINTLVPEESLHLIERQGAYN